MNAKDENKITVKLEYNALGVFWLVGYLFTLGLADPDHFWQALILVLAWPYHLGLIVRGLIELLS